MSQCPYAITMWDFSWLERRWPGAGYEDWDLVLDELAERGYNAVRIDAYPHLVSADSDKSWHLLPTWTENTWGAQSPIDVQVMPALATFIAKAGERGIRTALSTWFRRDRDDVRLQIRTPAQHGQIWLDTLHHLDDEGVLDQVLYVDLCNEWPLPRWAPFLYAEGEAAQYEHQRSEALIENWTAEAISVPRAQYPNLDYTFSVCSQYDTLREQHVDMLDLLEPHVWMANSTDYYHKVGYHYEPFSPVGYDNVVARGKSEFLGHQDEYEAQLWAAIDTLADWSRTTSKPLVTTECWAVVDYKDWPGLDWGWVNDLNAKAVEYAASTGRWHGMGTSNFTGPQFRGVWRDVSWHQRLTSLIKSAHIDDDIARQSS